jgi:serine phosphatase RsbU (regulator of sigma subunit)
MPVGMETAARKQAECVVPAGATLVWYTDGLVERRGQPVFTSLERLAAAAARLSRHDADGLCSALLHHMLDGQDLRDDTVVLCVRFTPVPGAAVTAAARAAPVAG